jgi:streptogramin lyase
MLQVETTMRFVILLLFAAVAPLACDNPTPGISNGDAGGDSHPGDSDSDSGDLVATILQPNGDLSVLAGASLTFEAEFLWRGIRVNPASVSWQTDLFLGDGNPLADQVLPLGSHVVTVVGIYGGDTASDSVRVTVGDLAVRILSPTVGTVEDVGSTIDFRGTAHVNDSGTVELVSAGAGAGQRDARFTWTSSLDGDFGSQRNFQHNLLNVGAHEITLTVTDDQGTLATGSAAVGIEIAQPNTPPTVAITEPVSCPVDLEQGGHLAMAGTVTDPDAADTDLGGTWLDTVSGHSDAGVSYLFGPGATLGKHQVVFAATDHRGKTDTATCDVFVILPGGTRADLFPDAATVNDNLLGGEEKIHWVGASPDGNTWIGNERGITVFDTEDALLATYDGDHLVGGPTELKIRGAAFADGTGFVATDHGLARCAFANGALSSCVEIVDEEFDAVVATGDPASNGVAVGASGAGLFVMEYASGALTQVSFNDGDSNLPATEVLDLLFVGAVLYVATNEGLCIVTDLAAAADGSSPLCTSVVDEKTSLIPEDDVRALAWFGQRLWLGTSGGAVQYDPAAGTMFIYDVEAGLGHDTVNDIVLDDTGVAWIATDAGVSRLNPATGTITGFTGADFGISGTVRVQSIFIDSNNTKWFGTNHGVRRYTGV